MTTSTNLPSRSKCWRRRFSRSQTSSSGLPPRLSRAMPWQVWNWPGSLPLPPKLLDVLLVLVELVDPVLPVAVGDEDVAVGPDGDAGGVCTARASAYLPDSLTFSKGIVQTTVPSSFSLTRALARRGGRRR